MQLAGLSQVATNVGTDFWIAFPPNSAGQTLQIFISSDFSTSGNVTSAFPGVNQSFTVTPGVVTQLTVPPGVQLLPGTENKGIHITAADPIAVYGLNKRSASTDAYLALPVPSLGVDYRVLTYTTAIMNLGTAFSVVATQDATSLTIYNHQTASTSTVTLNQGQTYLVESNAVNDDLTGSHIQSNFPVVVYGSVKLADVPLGCQAGDHIIEEMWPLPSWGKNFVTVPLAGRDGSGDIFRVLASEDATDVSINGTVAATLNNGDYYETNLTGYNEIVTSKAACVAQYAKGQLCTGNITGDPFMMLILPREQFLTNYTICTVAGFTSHWVNVVAPSYALGTILEDGVLIPNGVFTQIGTTNYWGAQRSVTQGSHTYSSTFPFGVFVYGWTNVDSYGYPGGGSLSPVGTVDSVSLSPTTASGVLNVDIVCLTAHVKDVFANPVAGVLVNFNVWGINPLVGNAYTNLAGDAQFCYTQTGTTPGTDSIYAEVFGAYSDTSRVFWSYIAPCNNPVTGGTIGNDQNGCGSFTPSTITNISLPSGQSGTLEYKWQQSIVSAVAGFTDIAGSDVLNWDPGLVTQTTWFRRMARVNCMTDWTNAALSNVVEMTVIPIVTPGVTVGASANSVCDGTTVTFTATPVNAGNTPMYQWKVNGVNAGINNPVYAYTPANGDVVTCILTSSEPCPSANPVSSNQVVMIVNPVLPVSISVTPSANPVCAGTLVSFTASPVNGGTTPIYQWKVNGINAGPNSPVYTYAPANGDNVICELTSSEICTLNNPVTSSPVIMVINIYLTVDISISASANPVCAGIPVMFTATPVNGGNAPIYQWKVNATNAGLNSPVFTYTPTNGDIVTCTLTSSLPCTSNNPASGNPISIITNQNPVVTFTACFDTITSVNAKPIRLKGGIPLSGTYSGPGVNPATGVFDPSAAGSGNKTISYSYTNVALCSATATRHIFNLPFSIFICGNPLTDIRDNQIYQTVPIGGQCWMAENLNYGTLIPASMNQRDNCINEKYCYNDLTANCGLQTANYQWDEIMRYDDTPGLQGLCPPGWHLPTDADWTQLIAFNNGPGFAGSSLLSTGLSGFNALVNGSRFMNSVWKFGNFATHFWTSSSHGTLKAWAHAMNNSPDDHSVSTYPAARADALSVRCLKD